MEYPSRNGISIPSSELKLPNTRLDIEQPYTTNLHHMEWSRRSMGRFLITQTLRDLDGMQERLPLDVHIELHRRYDPPAMPTPEQAMARLAIARDTGELMRIRTDGAYVLQEITDIHWKQILMEYDRVR